MPPSAAGPRIRRRRWRKKANRRLEETESVPSEGAKAGDHVSDWAVRHACTGARAHGKCRIKKLSFRSLRGIYRKGRVTFFVGADAPGGPKPGRCFI